MNCKYFFIVFYTVIGASFRMIVGHTIFDIVLVFAQQSLLFIYFDEWHKIPVCLLFIL